MTPSESIMSLGDLVSIPSIILIPFTFFRTTWKACRVKATGEAKKEKSARLTKRLAVETKTMMRKTNVFLCHRAITSTLQM